MDQAEKLGEKLENEFSLPEVKRKMKQMPTAQRARSRLIFTTFIIKKVVLKSY
jgi:hypothetical protein